MERNYEQNRGHGLEVGTDNDQALWDAFVKECLRDAAICDKIWKKKMEREQPSPAKPEANPEAIAEWAEGNRGELTDSSGFGDHVEPLAGGSSDHRAPSHEFIGHFCPAGDECSRDEEMTPAEVTSTSEQERRLGLQVSGMPFATSHNQIYTLIDHRAQQERASASL